MRPDPARLRRYHQLSVIYQRLNGSPTSLPPHYSQRQWSCLLLLLLLSVLLTFGYWTFQPSFSLSSTYLSEQFVVSVGNSSRQSTSIESANISITSITFPANISPVSTSTFSSHPNTTPITVHESHNESTLPSLFTNNSTTTELLTNTSGTFGFENPIHFLPLTNDSLCPNPPPALIGPIPVWLDVPNFDQLSKLYQGVRKGGHNWPDQCTARNRVAIIVPYRDRQTHLRIFLHNLHFLLIKQQLDYAIFIIEQKVNQTFNRGKLMNVGFVEASRFYEWQCFIFHDVDLLPEDDRNLYTCPEQPRHMSVAVDKFKYILPYSQIFGGATAMTREQFRKMNGYSNDYWGWGGEDDDMSYRLSYAGYKISRYPKDIARYKMIKHSKESMNPLNECRWDILGKTKQRWHRDGLSSLNYSVLDIKFEHLYTLISVDLLEDQSRKALVAEHITSKPKKGC